MQKKWRVENPQKGTTLLSFLRLKYKEKYSARKLKRAIDENLCFLNGSVENFANTPLKAQDVVLFYEQEINSLPPKKFYRESKRILYEDDHLIVYNKPYGINSDKAGLEALFHPGLLVHRLDRDTTGAIIIAKSQSIRQKLVALFKKQEVSKCYLALVEGAPKKNRELSITT